MSLAQATIWKMTRLGFSAVDITALITIKKSLSDCSSTDNAIRIGFDTTGRCCKADGSANTCNVQSKHETMNAKEKMKDFGLLAIKRMILSSSSQLRLKAVKSFCYTAVWRSIC